MVEPILPLNLSDLMITSLHFLYISLYTIILCLASYAVTSLFINLYLALLSYLCPRPQTDKLYWALRLGLYYLTALAHFGLLIAFTQPQGNDDRAVAPSIAWASAWTVSLNLVGTTTFFIVAFLIFKPLQLLDYWATSEITQPGIYESSRRNIQAGNGGKAPIVRLELRDGSTFGNACEHVNDEAVLTINSLCKDMEAGKTLAVHRAGTEGKRNEDFIGFFHLFETRGDSAGREGKKKS
jgi:hypothetical protein